MSASRVTFVACFLIAAGAAILGGFCLVRAWAISVPGTSQDHVSQIESIYPEVPAAQLVREWQQMEPFSEEIAMPYPYRLIADEKADWMRKGLLGMLTAAIAAGIAIAIGVIGRQPRAHA